jgi:predicted transcriptional regulator
VTSTWAELMSILRWMEQEGLVELFYDESGRECVRITPEGEKFEFAK